MTDADAEKLAETFRIVLELSDDEDLSKIRRISHPRWDSLAHVSLVSAIEGEFAVSFGGVNDVEELTSYAAARMLLTEKGI